ncbi:MAG: hypothetical protein ABWY06_08825 [Pseudomonas sp.]|uniref:hypothetical protein n=1 Tax=Pseudomonas sp. TaxID=306 RepID=UPI0033924C0B
MMAKLTIDLQEGFAEETVHIRIAGRQVYQQEQLSTRNQIGLAASFSIQVEEGPLSLDVLFPARGDKVEVINLIIQGDTYLGISLSATGALEYKASGAPFMYA